MKNKLLLVLNLTILLFYSCVTTAHNTTEINQQNVPNDSKKSKKTGSTIAYKLENGESLRTLIVTQNELNEFAKHENEPTDNIYKEMFSKYEKRTKEAISEKHEELDKLIKEMTEKDKNEFQKIFNMSIYELIDILLRVGFFYKIEYNKNTKEWYIELIGKSTTLKLGFGNKRTEGMSYGHYVSPHVKSWMDLNNIKDLDVVFRIYINDIDDDVIPEMFGFSILEWKKMMINDYVNK